MNQNPYAPPKDVPLPVAPPGELAGPQPWSVGEVVSLAWEALKRDWVVLVFAPFAAQLVAGVPNYIPAVALATQAVEPNSTEYWILYAICMIAALTVGTFFQVGLLRIFLAAARGQRADFAELFRGMDRFVPLLGATVLMFFVVFLGYLLLIVPGIILAIGLSLAQFYVVDAEQGPVEALKSSWEATKGHKGNLFLLGLAAFGLAILGLLACCLGYYVAMPVAWVAFSIAYLRISGRGAAPPAYPGAPPVFSR
jgi:uncharacterized membrane protein